MPPSCLRRDVPQVKYKIFTHNSRGFHYRRRLRDNAPGLSRLTAHYRHSMNELERQYKALPLEERLDLALSETLPEAYRPFMVCEQWMVIKCYFARRADLRPNEVEALIQDQDHVIRLCIAKRHDLTPSMVEKCVNDRDPNVRYFIARNPLINPEQRKHLLRDPDPLVSRAAQKGPREIQYRQRPGQARLIK